MDGDALAVDGLGGTEMACEPDVMAAETAYLGALGPADTVARDGADLVLTGDDVRLRFSPGAAGPDARPGRHPLGAGDPGGRRGRELDARASRLSCCWSRDRTVEASTGCRSVTGTWLLEDGALVIDDLLVTATAHPRSPGRTRTWRRSWRAAPAAEVDEDQLALTAPDGRGLVYRAG